MKMNVKNCVMAALICLCMALLLLPGLSKDASAGTAVASVTIQGQTTEYETLDEAILAVAECTAEDGAVVKLLQDIDLGTGGLKITAGAFTIDLNGKQILSESSACMSMSGATVDVTIADFMGNGEIRGKNYGVMVGSKANATIDGGFIVGEKYGVNVSYATATITGGRIESAFAGVCADKSTVTISGGYISSSGVNAYGVVVKNESTARISGGTIISTTTGNSNTSWGISIGVKCTVTISGGTIIAVGSGADGVHIENSNSSLIVTGGSITGDNIGVEIINATATIQNGSITGSSGHGMFISSGSVYVQGGTITGNYFGIQLSDFGAAIISGGTISAPYDIDGRKGTYMFTCGENGVGATFVGGISAYGITLDAVLSEGLAYWQNGEHVVLEDGQTQISGGDVIIKGDCNHQEKNYTNNGEDHTFTCTICGKEITEPHSYDETTLLCPCGAVSTEAVALVSKNGIPTSAYITLNDAVTAVSTATDEDQVVLMLLQDIDLGDGSQSVSSGVFTLDLNGKTLSGTKYGGILLTVDSYLTISDTAGGGKIAGPAMGVFVSGSVTLKGGDISGDDTAFWVAGDLTIKGGTATGDNGVIVLDGKLIVAGGVINGTREGIHTEEGSEVIISGGIIAGGNYDINTHDSTVILTRGEKGVGATFVDGISVSGATLEEILGEYAIYWQCGKMVVLTEGQTEITGCDVTVMDINTVVGIKGDLDGDGDVDAYDLTLLARYVGGIITDWDQDENEE